MHESKQKVLKYLTRVKDPEIPVLDIVEMGMVREVTFEDGGVCVTITPTYSGCPAMKSIEEEIIAELKRNDFGEIRVETVYAPAWTTDWFSPETRQKLKDYGIAPPETRCANPLTASPPDGINCPHCDSGDTMLRNAFGSTACKALYFCNGCRQPFEQFKCI